MQNILLRSFWFSIILSDLRPSFNSAGLNEPDPSVSINSNILSTVNPLALIASINLANNNYSNYFLYSGLSLRICANSSIPSDFFPPTNPATLHKDSISYYDNFKPIKNYLNSSYVNLPSRSASTFFILYLIGGGLPFKVFNRATMASSSYRLSNPPT